MQVSRYFMASPFWKKAGFWLFKLSELNNQRRIGVPSCPIKPIAPNVAPSKNVKIVMKQKSIHIPCKMNLQNGHLK